MGKKPKKPDKSVFAVLKDWEGKEILLTENVFKEHLSHAAHDEAYEYYETLKENISQPESVKISKNNASTKIANIKLSQRKHNYLRVVIRYGDTWMPWLDKRNYIVTFYGADSPIDGENVCLKKLK
ncbi:hypothetical protein DOJK_01041 [Patescibacteria group bacterium]|nr:hypothetical protein DOJK_01041 [Patescibacteria group bacterium]